MWTIIKSLPLSSGLRGLLIDCKVALQSELQHMYWTTLLLLGNWWICRAFHAHANSLSHQTSPTHLHRHCISINISHNSAPQHTWSSNISMPDLPFFLLPWAVQLQHIPLHFDPFHRYYKAFWKVSMESCQLHKFYNKLLMFLNVPTAFSPFL